MSFQDLFTEFKNKGSERQLHTYVVLFPVFSLETLSVPFFNDYIYIYEILFSPNPDLCSHDVRDIDGAVGRTQSGFCSRVLSKAVYSQYLPLEEAADQLHL